MRALIVLASLALAAPAVGQDTAGAAIKAFGLVGTWMPECRADVRVGCEMTPPGAKKEGWMCGGKLFEELPQRTVFAVPASGPAMRTSTVASPVPGRPPVTSTWPIQSAAPLGADRLKLRVTMTGDDIQRPPGRPENKDKGVVFDIVLLKKDGRMRTMDFASVDGGRVHVKDGFMYIDGARQTWQTPAFERCGS
ncbi:MAG TPA: hypothetical protein VMI56_00050 [Reyranella sp.]|nr:hypothetical protein [Reyranella sp.]